MPLPGNGSYIIFGLSYPRIFFIFFPSTSTPATHGAAILSTALYPKGRVLYEHLQEFEKLCSGLVILGMTQEALQWKLFPFSLIESADRWYTHTIGNMSGDWGELRDDFFFSFSLTEQIDSLPMDIMSLSN